MATVYLLIGKQTKKASFVFISLSHDSCSKGIGNKKNKTSVMFNLPVARSVVC